jgi:DNA-nicking Smr family endonuclease
MNKKDKPFNNPFVEPFKLLKKQLKAKTSKAEAVRKPIQQSQPAASDSNQVVATDEALFASAVANVVPGGHDERGRLRPLNPHDRPASPPILSQDAEVLADLASLIDSSADFEVSDSQEFIEGCASDLDRRVLKRLRAGEYPLGDRLDLHGLTREKAHQEVVRFIEQARRDRLSCVLIVHGRGLRSSDHIPVLKGLLKQWLQQGRMAKSVLAFCSARPHDGGTGAVYVLLRRERS